MGAACGGGWLVGGGAVDGCGPVMALPSSRRQAPGGGSRSPCSPLGMFGGSPTSASSQDCGHMGADPSRPDERFTFTRRGASKRSRIPRALPRGNVSHSFDGALLPPCPHGQRPGDLFGSPQRQSLWKDRLTLDLPFLTSLFQLRKSLFAQVCVEANRA